MNNPVSTALDPGQARMLAKGLGWFSIALGLSELLAPGRIKQSIGAETPKAMLQAFGLREIASGVAILASNDPNKMVWTRVAGDMLDLATLAPTLRGDNPQRPGAAGAVAFVALATAADIFVAMQNGNPDDRHQGLTEHVDRANYSRTWS